MQKEGGGGACYAGADNEGFWGRHNSKVSVVKEGIV